MAPLDFYLVGGVLGGDPNEVPRGGGRGFTGRPGAEGTGRGHHPARRDPRHGLLPAPVLLDWVAQAGLTVLGRLDAKPRHSKASDTNDPLHSARAAEITSLW